MKEITIKTDCQVGICPVCGEKLEYTSTDKLYGWKEWFCNGCGSYGKEGIQDGHPEETLDGKQFSVRTKDGAKVKLIPATTATPAAPPAPVTVDVMDFEDGVCPICGAPTFQTGKDHPKINGIDYEWECEKCDATGWAEYSEEWITTFDGYHNNVKLKDGTPVVFNILDPATPKVGRIDYLMAPSGPVSYSHEYTAEDSFVADVLACVEQGVPTKVYLYMDDSGKTISPAFARNLDHKVCTLTVVGQPKQWKLPVCWEMCGYIYVTAPTLEAAMDKVRHDHADIDLPEDTAYSDGSFALSYDDTEEIRSLHNDNQTDSAVDVVPFLPVIGRIDFLSSIGKVTESICYATVDDFLSAVKHESDNGAPMVIYLYQDRNGNTISNNAIISRLGCLPAGFKTVAFQEMPRLERIREVAESLGWWMTFDEEDSTLEFCMESNLFGSEEECFRFFVSADNAADAVAKFWEDFDPVQYAANMGGSNEPSTRSANLDYATAIDQMLGELQLALAHPEVSASIATCGGCPVCGSTSSVEG